MRRMMSFGLALAVAGCSQQMPVPVAPVADFCALTEQRRFGAEEFAWRLEHAPGNLRYQIEQNDVRAAKCPAPAS